jgi:hypothetical protein
MNKFDNEYIPDLISLTLGDKVLCGLQAELNRSYNRKYRVIKEINFNGKYLPYGKGFTFKIKLPNNKFKIYKVKVNEVKKR